MYIHQSYVSQIDFNDYCTYNRNMAEKIARRKPDPDRKSEVIPVRCTAKQKRTLEKRAKNRGLGVSTWLLQLGLSAPDDPVNE